MLDLATEFYTSEDVGARLLIHNNRERPFPGDESIILSPGYHTFVGFQKSKVVRQKPPYGECEDLSKEEHEQKSFYADKYDYSKDACSKTCVQIHAMLFCNCCLESHPCKQLPSNMKISYSTKPFHEMRYCNESEAQKCSDVNKGKPFLEKCQSGCKPPCEETSYQVKLSSAKWPPRNHIFEVPDYWTQDEIRAGNKGKPGPDQNNLKFLYEFQNAYANSQTNNQIGVLKSTLCTGVGEEWWTGDCENFEAAVVDMMLRSANHYNYMYYASEKVKVTIFPESLEVKTVKTSPKYDWVGFLSNIGGVMGLFTGFSILSFLEIVELLFDLLGSLLSMLCKNIIFTTS